ncbi:MAG TPA: tetratricopeptide repeat protein [Bryobacteraceae bacterium]|jgi:tetratricopeptide (TPR) repeat protein|nr:tetratricopeptide repeat protein [Bryobacteraceae bacterium]
MSGRILTPVFLAASLSLFGQTSGSQQQQQNPPANPPKLERRASEKTSGKEVAPPEEDTSIGNANSFSFNPLQAKKDIEVGNEYAKKHNFRAAANRFTDATKHNDQDAEAWLRLGEAQERLKDHQAAREAYSKYLEIASDAKNANDIRKRLDKLK